MEFVLGLLLAVIIFAAHATGFRWGREGLIEDARRYRWLRQQPIDAPEFRTGMHVVDATTVTVMNGEHLDAAIDAAMEVTGARSNFTEPDGTGAQGQEAFFRRLEKRRVGRRTASTDL